MIMGNFFIIIIGLKGRGLDALFTLMLTASDRIVDAPSNSVLCTYWCSAIISPQWMSNNVLHSNNDSVAAANHFFIIDELLNFFTTSWHVLSLLSGKQIHKAPCM